MAGNFFTGHPASAQQFTTVTPQQQGLKSAANNQAMNFLQQLGGNFGESPIAKRAITQFNTQTIPGLAERFTAMGPGAQRGSAFQSQLGQAGANLQGGLAALEQQNAMQLLPQLFGSALAPEFENAITQADSGIVGQIIPAITAILAAYFGAPSNTFNSFGNPSREEKKDSDTNSNTNNQTNSSINQFNNPFNKPIIPNYSSMINQITQQPIGQGINFPNYNQLISNVLQGRSF